MRPAFLNTLITACGTQLQVKNGAVHAEEVKQFPLPDQRLSHGVGLE